jgi:hypothetical protein
MIWKYLTPLLPLQQTSTGVEVFGNELNDPDSKNNPYNNNCLCY